MAQSPMTLKRPRESVPEARRASHESEEEEGEVFDEPDAKQSRLSEGGRGSEPGAHKALNFLERQRQEQQRFLAREASSPTGEDADDDPAPIRNRWADDEPPEPAPADTKSRWLLEDDDHADQAPSEGRSLPGEAPPDGGAGAGGRPSSTDGLTPPPGEASPAAPEEPERANMLAECRSKEAFDFLKEIGVGTYGAVSKARDKATNEIRALKKIKLDKMYQKEGFPMTSLREINILLSMQHDNIVNVTEVVTNAKNEIYMVMEFVQQDLKKFLERYKSKLKIGEVKRIIWQLLSAMAYLHENWVLHRDLKPANILYDHLGNVKICDFGLARRFGSPVHPMTPLVVTRNYRGPEIPMGVRTYSPALDIWSVGIIAAELITQKVPFVKSESDLMLPESIAQVIGSPHDVWKGFKDLPNADKINITRNLPSRLKERLGAQLDVQPGLMIDTALSPAGYDLIESMLRWDPTTRISAADALRHEWFVEMPKMCEACFMPQLTSGLSTKYPQF